MGNLISILNSGESLEKAVVLTKLALEGNPPFYSQYEKIIVFYCENLPKRGKELESHGTVGGIIKNLRKKDFLKYKSLEEIWDDRDTVLNNIYNMGRISQRVGDRLKENKGNFDKIIANFPWYQIQDKFRDFLTENFLSQGSISLEFINFRGILNWVDNDVNMPNYSMAKIYVLNADGSISSLNPFDDDKRKKDFLNRGIVLSPMSLCLFSECIIHNISKMKIYYLVLENLVD